jgi:hypothetical protein
MEVNPALALPDGLELVGFEKIDDMLTMTIVSTQEPARCPRCHQPSMRVHSRYTRRVADLPCGDQHLGLGLVLHVRKFFCNDWATFLKIRSVLTNNDNNVLKNNKSCAKI